MAKTLSTSGITSNDTIRAGHVTQSVDALTGTEAYDITISGSLSLPGTVVSGSFIGDGTGLTGVTGEWDGSHNGNASITGSLTVTGGVSGSISLNDGQTIEALNGSGQLDLRAFNTDGIVVLNTSASNYDSSYLYMTPGLSGEVFLQGQNVNNYLSLNNNEVNIATENGLIFSGSYIRPFGQNVTDLGFPTRLFKTIYGVTGSFDYLKNSNSSTITVQDSITFQSAITASGDISSSGTIIANKIESSNLVSHLGDANTGIAFGNDTVVIEANDINMAIFSTTGQTIGNVGYTTNIIGSSVEISNSLTCSNLPTTEPTTTGSMWISGSSVAHPNSGYLMIFNP